MDHEFTGRAALVTGAASGVGAAVAEMLAARAAAVLVADLDRASFVTGSYHLVAGAYTGQ